MDDFNPNDDKDKAYLAAALTAYALGLSVEDILAPGRGSQAHAGARQVAIYLLTTGCGFTYQRAALAFSRDRSTIGHACRSVEDRRDDPDFDDWIVQLELGLSSVVGLRVDEAAA